jgi:hypothetical protein
MEAAKIKHGERAIQSEVEDVIASQQSSHISPTFFSLAIATFLAVEA